MCIGLPDSPTDGPPRYLKPAKSSDESVHESLTATGSQGVVLPVALMLNINGEIECHQGSRISDTDFDVREKVTTILPNKNLQGGSQGANLLKRRIEISFDSECFCHVSRSPHILNPHSIKHIVGDLDDGAIKSLENGKEQ